MRPPSITTSAWMLPWRDVPQPRYVPSFQAGAAVGAGAAGCGASIAVGAVTDATGGGGAGVSRGEGAGALTPRSAIICGDSGSAVTPRVRTRSTVGLEENDSGGGSGARGRNLSPMPGASIR